MRDDNETWGSLEEISEGERGARNAPINTPAAIAEAIRETNEAIQALARDINESFRVRFERDKAEAEKKFRAAHGREPGEGIREWPPGPEIRRDWAEVYGSMGVEIDSPEYKEQAYQGLFVRQFRAFLDEWEAFRIAHTGSWWRHAWISVGDNAVRFRKRAAEWRKKFEQLGGATTTPAPDIPPSSIIPWGKVLALGALILGIVAVPPLLSVVAPRRQGP